MARLEIDGGVTEFDDVGEGRSALLLIHGHPFDRSMWRPQLEHAARQGWRAIAPDLRGYGGSGPAGSKTWLEDFAADLVRLLDRLRLDRAVVCGLSMGGQIAMALCERHPERVRGLLLTATFETADTLDGVAVRLAAAARIEREGMARYADELLPKMLSARTLAFRPAVASELLAMMRRAPADGAAAALRGRAERPSYAEALRRYEGPATVVVGDEDAFTTLEDARRMSSLLRDCELVTLRGVGHMPNLEAPGDFNAALDRLMVRADRELVR